MFSQQDDFSPWALLGDTIAWLLIVGIAVAVITVIIVTILTIRMMLMENKKDKEFLRRVEKNEHPTNHFKKNHLKKDGNGDGI